MGTITMERADGLRRPPGTVVELDLPVARPE